MGPGGLDEQLLIYFSLRCYVGRYLLLALFRPRRHPVHIPLKGHWQRFREWRNDECTIYQGECPFHVLKEG